jgi:HK97 family phage prohead protease
VTDRRPDNRVIFTGSAATRLKFEAAPAGATDKIATLKGYPLVWNVLSSDRGGFKVRLLPGSARFTPLAHALYHHEYTGGPLADTETSTLRIGPADDYGQPVEIDLPNTTIGRDVLELVRTGRLKGMSFAMVDAPASTEKTENGQAIVEARDYLVDEVTITAIPAFSQASVGLAGPAPAYATRTAHALTLERMRFDLLRLPAARARRAG